MSNKKKGSCLIILLLAVAPLCAQTVSGVQTDGSRQNNIIAAVPFLLITPQARAGAMGNAGVALDADASTIALNVAGLAFLPVKSGGVSLSYSPWLKHIANDMSLSYLSGYYRFNERSTLVASFRYFSLGDVELTDVNFQNLGIYKPNEVASDLSYVRSFGPDFALGGTLRYIYSGLYNTQFGTSGATNAGQAIAADITGIFKKQITLFSLPTVWSVGFNLSNIGTKVSYCNEGTSYFLPANFKIGTAAALMPNEDNRFVIAIDFNKLMVPTQPVYDAGGNIVKGQTPDRSVPAGIFGSFTDAPGGFAEELKEIGIATGVEYSYQQKFALRAGYNYQHPDKGNGRYLSLGAGFSYKAFNIDFAYIAANVQSSPLANTLRFTLQAQFGHTYKTN